MILATTFATSLGLGAAALGGVHCDFAVARLAPCHDKDHTNLRWTRLCVKMAATALQAAMRVEQRGSCQAWAGTHKGATNPGADRAS